MRALTSTIIHTGTRDLTDYAIIIQENGFIKALVPTSDVPKEIKLERISAPHIAPGFIDLQVNGSGGFMFGDQPTDDCINTIAHYQYRFGVTGFLPTLISGPLEVMSEATKAVDKAIKNTPGVLGIHFEGPFLNPKHTGIHEVKMLKKYNDSLECHITPCKFGKTLVTLAPELIKNTQIQNMTSKGILVAAGHTSAGPADISRATEAGLTGVTHLFNAMEQMTARSPGTVGAALTNDALWCSIIADGFHVHPTTLLAAWRAKPVGKLILVSDSMAPVGKKSMTKFMSCGQEIYVKDGKCTNSKNKLAGSLGTLDSAVRFCVTKVGIPLNEALRMASTYPAKAIGEDNRRGLIEPGYVADLVSLDHKLYPQKIWISGTEININTDKVL